MFATTNKTKEEIQIKIRPESAALIQFTNPTPYHMRTKRQKWNVKDDGSFDQLNRKAMVNRDETAEKDNISIP